MTALKNWNKLVPATNILTLNKLQFFGMITNEYLAHMTPVAANDPDCETLKVSTGRDKSPIPATTKP